MIRVGQKVAFDPFKYLTGYGCLDIKGEIVTGTVTDVNEEHRWFSVSYGDNQRTSFKFDDIGGEVSIIG